MKNLPPKQCDATISSRRTSHSSLATGVIPISHTAYTSLTLANTSDIGLHKPRLQGRLSDHDWAWRSIDILVLISSLECLFAVCRRPHSLIIYSVLSLYRGRNCTGRRSLRVTGGGAARGLISRFWLIYRPMTDEVKVDDLRAKGAWDKGW